MRITDETRFPHPVLSLNTGDFVKGEFSVEFTGREVPTTGALVLEHNVTLTEPAIRDLVTTGGAAVGCFVRCNDTFYTELRRLSWPMGRSDFAPGMLLNRVTLQPMIWLEKPLASWDPGTIHSEFEPPISLAQGDVVALAPEHVMSVGQAKFAPVESIFELLRSTDITEGQIAVDPERDRIGITVSPETFETIYLLRGQARGQPVVMNGIYIPAVMDVLDLLREGGDQYDGRRWHQPFMARCDAKGIDVGTEGGSLFEDAQRLLDRPARMLSALVTESEA